MQILEISNRLGLAKLLFVPFVFTLCYFQSCNKELDGDLPGSKEVELVTDAVSFQEEVYDLLMDRITSEGDTIAAKEFALQKILEYPEVDYAGTNSQGIYIQYKNGMRGGLIIDFEDEPGNGVLSIKESVKKCENSAPLGNVVPSAKRTIILNPHFDERESYTNVILSAYNEKLPEAGFDKPVLLRDKHCTVKEFASLEGYGIIHIYSHSIPWPSNTNIQKVYLLTGEVYNKPTFIEYFDYYEKKDFGFFTHDRKTRFYVSSEFIAAENNFSEDTTLIYGGFCHSFNGSWPEKMTNAGAAGYFGFNWAVFTDWNVEWARTLITELSDNSRFVPFNVSSWYQSHGEIKYPNVAAPEDYVHLLFEGNPELALLPTKAQVDLTKVNEVKCDLMATINWSCDNQSVTIQKISSPVLIRSEIYTREWNYATTFTGSIPGTIVGNLYLRFDDSFTMIDSFYVYNQWLFDADDEELIQNGYPRTKTQSYSGHDLPLWVNQPDLDRYIYGVQGSDASDYLSTLDCEYEFPDGSSCKIEEFEFTDETLQMIRLDFYIR